ncbi:FUSC family protein [Streptomyces caniscabiei]|uniref:FUSC family protein n=1 Tax=Streptomyces caniscabiei TaxID=2746961 RepID=A0ABU4N3T4_9ACTN|nr:FUSC family protein [Streptomyces caniscabiei]MBE4741928.1 FUSC family protein [Streptomyces caniscabiei]MBE4759507.1 FUSC family protein [Streptomyces caniscabiei]MBE4773209.1 FUSC family protein [Streptomyces caniscabiei]MBE4790753.1 FUSC family protein [Streptomyces caniscabiei]MBE4797964.1 FUSC family protein [Streptomyces caniscabiei]
MFTAPDPGHLRLRTALRAVIGVGAAVTASELGGLSLPASITGGLAALLALFTVTDADVPAQRLTTALLPAAGFPVLAVAAVLHDAPAARDAAFVATVFCGVYARRWGPRGQALGIFAFMSYFITQFLHTVPADLLGLYAAMTLALLVAGVVRFLLWPVERRLPPVALPAGPAGAGLARPTTRQACQAAVACCCALLVGQAFSEDRWYWAVGTAWWIFVNTASRGETLVRGFRRVLGTVIGVAVGLLVAVPLDGAPAPSAALVAVCVFGIFYTAAVSYSWMMLAVTVMVSLLYGLLGVLDPGLLALRLVETGVGAVCAMLAVVLVLPVTTHATNDAWIQRALHCVHAAATATAARLEGVPGADPAPHAAELELLFGRARMALAPLVHPLHPFRARKARAHAALRLLDDCVGEVRALVSATADPSGTREASLIAACWRVKAAVEALTTPGARATASGPETVAPAEAGAALGHLHNLERALSELAHPLGTPPGSRTAA